MPVEESNTCCFTGHRPDKLPWGREEGDPRCIQLKYAMADAVRGAYDLGYRHFICGMARGCDLYFAQEVLELRHQFDDVTLEAARPCETQGQGWPQEERARYDIILEQCDYETLVQQHYDRGCFLRRNRYMVERSSLLIAAYDGVPQGGTASTIHYALRKKLRVEILHVEREDMP